MTHNAKGRANVSVRYIKNKNIETPVIGDIC